jgi:hypothetical protein
MAVTMKNGVSWDVTPRDSCNNRRFGGTYRVHHQDDSNIPEDAILQFSNRFAYTSLR